MKHRLYMPALLCGIGLCAVLSACSLLLDDAVRVAPDSPFQTDQRHYFAEVITEEPARVELAIPMTYTNTTDQTVYLIGCKHPSMPVLEKLVDGAWIVAYAPIELLCLSPPWILQPGERFQDTLEVYGALPGQNMAPTFDTEIDGTYRLVRAVYTDPDGTNLLPESLHTSNTFEIEQRTGEPDHTYQYTAYNDAGEALVTGLLYLDFEDTGDASYPVSITGTWALEQVGEDDPIGSQVGEGRLRGSIDADGNVGINLNPDWDDNNVTLNGRFANDPGDPLEGTWIYSTFVGGVNGGIFEAERL